MNHRKLVGTATLGVLVLLGFGSRFVTGFSQDDWDPWYRMAYIIAVCGALFAACYDRKNLPEKAWDFNPKRGLVYFLLGWILFPVMIAINAISGSDFTLSNVVLATLALSVLIGVVGSFTENVGV